MFLFKKKKFKKDDSSIFNDFAKAKDVMGFLSVIDRLPNPDIVLRSAGKCISVLRTLVNHYQVGTCVDSRKAGTLGERWELRPNNCDKKQLSFFEELFTEIDIYKLIEDILDSPLYGYNPIEISYEKENGLIRPIKLTAKPQEWFLFNSEGDFYFNDKNGKRLIDFAKGVKFLLPRHKPSYLNPYGQAILSRCFWNVAFIEGGMEFFVKFCEKFGMPYIFGRYDRSMNDNEKQDLLEKLILMVQDAIGVIPNDSSVEIVQTGASGSSDIHLNLINKCENNIAKAILGQSLTTDTTGTGSYALGKVHAGVREDIVKSDKRLVEKTINHFIKIVSLINFDDAICPEFSFIEEEDLGLMQAERDNKIYALGVEFTEDYLLRTYNYKKGDIKVGQRAVNMMNFADEEPLFDKESNELIQPIIDFFQKTRNAEDTLEKLAELYPDLNTKELEKRLANIIFAAELKGRLNVQENNRG